jgi:cytoskeletal protein RodZ
MARRLPATLLHGRVRTSTLLLSLLFVAVLILYIQVRPPSVASTGSQGGSGPAGDPPPATSAPVTTSSTTSTGPAAPTTSTTPTSAAPTSTTPTSTSGRAAPTSRTSGTSTTSGATTTSR